MTKSVYELAGQKFNDVSAYVIHKDGKHLCNISLKYPKDGMGRLYGFIHCFGLQMEVSFVSGCGYDKRSAVICKLVNKQLEAIKNSEFKVDIESKNLDYIDLCENISLNGEGGWDIDLYKTYSIIQVI